LVSRQQKGDRTPRANSAEEAAFLALGPGSASWLIGLANEKEEH
jgi:hypothetical protein